MRRATFVLVGAALVAGLAGCASGSSGNDSGGSGGSSAPDVPAGTVLTTADSDLGKIVVDGQGMTVYYYTPDVPGSGTSTCTDACLAAWPPVHATGDDPQVDGVTGDVGTIMGNDGERQVTVDGRPLYLYVGDGEPGDVTGQGIDGIWWVVAPDGTEVRQIPRSPDTSGY